MRRGDKERQRTAARDAKKKAELVVDETGIADAGVTPYELLVSAFQSPTTPPAAAPSQPTPKRKRPVAPKRVAPATVAPPAPKKLEAEEPVPKDEAEDPEIAVHRTALEIMDRVMERAGGRKAASASTERSEATAADRARHDREDAEETAVTLADLDGLIDDDAEGSAAAAAAAAGQDPFDAWCGRTVPDNADALLASATLTHGDDPDLGCVAWTSDKLPVPTAAGGDAMNVAQFGIKTKLLTRWNELHGNSAASSPLQAKLMALFTSYSDVLVARSSTLADRKVFTKAYLLHVLNHVFKSRDRELKHTAKKNMARNSGETYEIPADQGFTRPRVLVLLPFRSSCWDTATAMIEMLPGTVRSRVESATKLKLQYFVDAVPPQLRTPRPREFEEIFHGNTDDCFALGVAFTRSSVRLFTTYAKSDIIFASPLGLRLLTGDIGDKRRDTDFLTSIELLVIDQADVMIMQNFEHVDTCVRSLNLLPRNANDTDFSRVRQWFLEGKAKYYRQSIIFTQALMPEINALFNRQCFNTLGKIRAVRLDDPSISRVALKVRQVFQRVDCNSVSELADARLKYFQDEVLPHLTGTIQSRTLVYVASYFDFIRLRNMFLSEQLSFVSICEYSDKVEQSKSRSLFATGRCEMMLYTERFHYYHRYTIRGAQNVVFYGLPTFGQFYSEIINALSGASAATVLALYSKFEHLQLERIIGDKRAEKLISASKTTHLFC